VEEFEVLMKNRKSVGEKERAEKRLFVIDGTLS
jgi:hypothetical protein